MIYQIIKYLMSLTIVMVSVTTGINQHLSEEMQQKINQICQEAFKRGNFPGMAVVVARKDMIVWSKGYGYANIEEQIPVNPQKSIFRKGSISAKKKSLSL